MKKLGLLIALALLFSCHDKKRECEFTTKDEVLKVYNDILDELVVKHFYDIYLGSEAEELYEKYSHAVYNQDVQRDTMHYHQDLEKLREKIENDTALQSNICLKNQLTSGPWTYRNDNDSDSLNFEPDLIAKMNSFLLRSHQITDSLQIVQSNYSEADFHSCKFKITAFKTFNKCSIGIIGFSKISFNKTKDKAILYYEFLCGGNCGMGEVVLVELKNNKWRIIDKSNIWIS